MTIPAISNNQEADATLNLYFNKTYRTTHNSYSGEERGSIRQQLDSGVRCLELDVLVTKVDGIIVGHELSDDPKKSHVSSDHGNPDTRKLRPWLEIIKNWSDKHDSHDPITISFDLKPKGDPDDTWGAGGGMAQLQTELMEVFPNEQRFDSSQLPKDDLTYNDLLCKIISVHNSNEKSDVLFYMPAFRIGKTPDNVMSAGHFINFSSDDLAFMPSKINKFLRAGFAVRVYKIDGNIGGLTSGVTFAATDHPYQSPYQEYQRDNPGLAPEITFQEVTWHKVSHYDNGKEPSIAINDQGVAVEVHKSQNSTNLFYRVGKLSTAAGKANLEFDSSGAKFMRVQGVRPMVAICGQNICLVYKSSDSNRIMYRTGLLAAGVPKAPSNDAVTWETAKELKSDGKVIEGTYPSVSMCKKNGKIMVLVTLMQAEPKVHCWAVGKMDEGLSEVTWQSLRLTDDENVDVPEMEINSGPENGDPEVTMVWEWGEHVYCRVGVLREASGGWDVKWKTDGLTYPLIYDTGRRPSVALLADGALIEIHGAVANSGLWSRTGKRSGTVAVWDISEKISEGDVSRIAAGAGYVVEVHKSAPDDEYELWYTLGTYSL